MTSHTTHFQRCSHLGCALRALACYLREDDLRVEEFLCPEHAAEAGYCSVCGLWAADQPGFALAPLCMDCLEEFDHYRPAAEDDPGW